MRRPGRSHAPESFAFISAPLRVRVKIPRSNPHDDFGSGRSPCAVHNVVMPEAPTLELYCPKCARLVTDPLVCGDCLAVICRVCGTPLERPDELGIG
jgi:hypothetical protein